MGFYDTKKNIENYIHMAHGYDGKELVAALRKYAPKRASALELGMGPGVDFELLERAGYIVTGSDSSELFLQRYRDRHPKADLMRLDASTLDTERQFDVIYSNKVLHHLTRIDLAKSFRRQHELLRSGGIAIHGLWYGDTQEKMHGLLFINYTEETIREIIDHRFETLLVQRYTEMSTDDSLCVVVRRA